MLFHPIPFHPMPVWVVSFLVTLNHRVDWHPWDCGSWRSRTPPLKVIQGITSLHWYTYFKTLDQFQESHSHTFFKKSTIFSSRLFPKLWPRYYYFVAYIQTVSKKEGGWKERQWNELLNALLTERIFFSLLCLGPALNGLRHLGSPLSTLSTSLSKAVCDTIRSLLTFLKGNFIVFYNRKNSISSIPPIHFYFPEYILLIHTMMQICLWLHAYFMVS